MLKHDDEETLANELTDFFIGKVKRIRQELDNKPDLQTITIQHPKIKFLQSYKLATKSCKLDPVPTSLLKAILPAVLPTITVIMNTSLKHGIFTKQMENSNYMPLLKKKD